MFFCLDCGVELISAPDTGWQSTDAKTAEFGENATVVRNQPLATQYSAVAYSAPKPPSGSKKIFVVLGGLAALVLLLIIAVAAIVGYNYFSKSRNAVTTGNSTSSNVNKTSSGNNSSSPAVNATPSVSFTPPTDPTRSGTFTVYANGGWQLSPLDTVPLEEFRTKVEGKVDIVGVKTGISASGVTDEASKSRRVYPEFPTGALLMRTRYADGKFSNVMAMTTSGANGSWQNFPDERGRMEFCVNDNAPEKNGGQFTVTLTFTKIGKPKK
jgi:hypothetical protein